MFSLGKYVIAVIVLLTHMLWEHRDEQIWSSTSQHL